MGTMYRILGISHNSITNNYECEQTTYDGVNPSYALIQQVHKKGRTLLTQAGFDILETSSRLLLSYEERMEQIADSLNNHTLQEGSLTELFRTEFEKTAQLLPEIPKETSSK